MRYETSRLFHHHISPRAVATTAAASPPAPSMSTSPKPSPKPAPRGATARWPRGADDARDGDGDASSSSDLVHLITPWAPRTVDRAVRRADDASPDARRDATARRGRAIVAVERRVAALRVSLTRELARRRAAADAPLGTAGGEAPSSSSSSSEPSSSEPSSRRRRQRAAPTFVRRLTRFVERSPLRVPGSAFDEASGAWTRVAFPRGDDGGDDDGGDGGDDAAADASTRPYRRADVLLVERWMCEMLREVDGDFKDESRDDTSAHAATWTNDGEAGGASSDDLAEAALWIHRVAFEELVRFASVGARARPIVSVLHPT